MANPKSLMEFICESIDEALLAGSPITGRDVYLRAFDRCEQAHFERERKRVRRELEASLPLLAPILSEIVEDFSE